MYVLKHPFKLSFALMLVGETLSFQLWQIFVNVHVKKIISLHSFRRKKLIKVNKSKCLGTGTEGICKPTLRYFDLMSFLRDRYFQTSYLRF